MRFPRRSGILLHVSSLPSPFGIGDMGRGAFEFIDFLSRAGQRIWQVLPVCPTAKGNSPYSGLSAFAGNPLLISPVRLVEEGLLDESDLEIPDDLSSNAVHYEVVGRLKLRLFDKSYRRFIENASATHRDDYERFCERDAWWLDDFALFVSLINELGEADWSRWDPDLARRRPEAIAYWKGKLVDQIEFVKYVQFLFARQWRSLRAHAERHGIDILGDMPIFVAHESADVWINPEYFHLDRHGRPTVVAGVPPDAYSELGQLWGNPLFDWERIAASNYDWWVRRLRHAFSLFGILRVDHFRAFEAYWEIPAGAPTALKGRWIKGPGAAPFRTAERELGPLRIVAEDLGMITLEVHKLREALGFPGMRVLQFGFEDAEGFHRPDNYPQHCVAYTGTHDNDTLVGWLQSRAGLTPGCTNDSNSAESRAGTDVERSCWALIGEVFHSAADTAVVPLQDLLALGGEARMNVPGRAHGNWSWRVERSTFGVELERRLRELTIASGRGTN